MKLTITANYDDTATLQNNNTEVLDNTKHILDSICYDEYASTSTNKNYMIDVPDILEMIDTHNPDPKSKTEEEQNTEETMLIPVPPMDFAHFVL